MDASRETRRLSIIDLRSRQRRVHARIQVLKSKQNSLPSFEFNRQLLSLQRQYRSLRTAITRLKFPLRRSRRLIENSATQPENSDAGNVTHNQLQLTTDSPCEIITTFEVGSTSNSTNEVSTSTDVILTRNVRFNSQWTFTNNFVECLYCGASMWSGEKTRKSRVGRPEFTLCCQFGQVQLPPLPDHPQLMKDLLRDNSFRTHIRLYNAMFAFTSMGGSVDHSVNDGRGPYTFRISGSNYHKIGSLLPPANAMPKFIQLYMYDTEQESCNRLNAIGPSSGANLQTIEALQEMMYDVNPYSQLFKHAKETMTSHDNQEFKIRLLQGRPGGQYSRPTSSDLAAIIVGSENDVAGTRD